ncbi:uncharacterized protein LOC144347283, partial [Saccoglossus kowalevskii]
LNQYFKTNEVTDEGKQVAIFRIVIGPKTYDILRNVLAPVKPSTKPFSELVEILNTNYNPRPLTIAERFKFHGRNQLVGESVAKFLAELRHLAEKCEFGTFLNEALRDRFVCGMRDSVTQKKLLTVSGLTLDRAFELAQSYETANKQASELQANTKEHEVCAVYSKTNSYAKKPCFRCGKTNHFPDKCYYKEKLCRKCNKRGHIAIVCRATQSRTSVNKRKSRIKCVWQDNSPSSDSDTEGNDIPEYYIGCVHNTTNSTANIVLHPEVNGVKLEMELDTGASVSIISEETWKHRLGSVKLNKPTVSLKTYTGEPLKILQMTAKVQYNEQQVYLPLTVIRGSGPSLFGRDWLSKLKVDWSSVNRVSSDIGSVLDQYQELFQDELGTLKGIKAELVVQPDATPKFVKPRPVPYALRTAIENDLNRLERMKVIEKVD